MDAFRSADYRSQDDQYCTPVYFVRKTTTELTALAAAKQIEMGTLYFDTITQQMKVGYDPALGPILLLNSGNPINSTPVGATTPATGSFTSLRYTSLLSALTDSSGTPGNVTNAAAHGRVAFAAAGTAVVVTSALCAANSTVLVSLGGADVTLTSVRVTPGAGSFTITGNAAATGITPCDFVIINN